MRRKVAAPVGMTERASAALKHLLIVIFEPVSNASRVESLP